MCERSMISPTTIFYCTCCKLENQSLCYDCIQQHLDHDFWICNDFNGFCQCDELDTCCVNQNHYKQILDNNFIVESFLELPEDFILDLSGSRLIQKQSLTTALSIQNFNFQDSKYQLLFESKTAIQSLGDDQFKEAFSQQKISYAMILYFPQRCYEIIKNEILHSEIEFCTSFTVMLNQEYENSNLQSSIFDAKMEHYQNYFVRFQEMVGSNQILLSQEQIIDIVENKEFVYDDNYFYPIPPIFVILTLNKLRELNQNQIHQIVHKFILPFQQSYLIKIKVFNDFYKRNSLDLNQFLNELNTNGNLKLNEINAFRALKQFFVTYQKELAQFQFYKEFLFRIFISQDNYTPEIVFLINLTNIPTFCLSEIESLLPFNFIIKNLPSFIKDNCEQIEFDQDYRYRYFLSKYQEDFLFNCSNSSELNLDLTFWENTQTLQLQSSKAQQIYNIFTPTTNKINTQTIQKINLKSRLSNLKLKLNFQKESTLQQNQPNHTFNNACDLCHQELIYKIFSPVLFVSEISNFSNLNIPVTCGHNFHYKCIKNEFFCPYCSMEMQYILIRGNFNFKIELFDKFPLILRPSANLLQNLTRTIDLFNSLKSEIIDGELIQNNLKIVQKYLLNCQIEPLTTPITALERPKLTLPKTQFEMLSCKCGKCNLPIPIETLIICIFCGEKTHAQCRSDHCFKCQKYLIFHPSSMRIIDHENQLAIQAPYRNFFGEIPQQFFGRKFVLDEKLERKIEIYGILGYWKKGVRREFSVVLGQYQKGNGSDDEGGEDGSFQEVEVSEV